MCFGSLTLLMTRNTWKYIYITDKKFTIFDKSFAVVCNSTNGGENKKNIFTISLLSFKISSISAAAVHHSKLI